MDEITKLEEAYPVAADVHGLPFPKCDWATEKVLTVL